jgi:phage-related protein
MRRILLAFVMSFPVWAQDHGSPGLQLIERLNRMSPEERRRLLNRMPSDRRMVLEKRIDKLNSMKPEAREKALRDYEYFQQLPPEKQNEARRVLKKIADLPEERRKMLRTAIHHLREQGPELRQRRMESRGYHDRFSEDERKLIREALDALPPQPEVKSQ